MSTLSENLDPRFKTSSDIQDITSFPCFSAEPHLLQDRRENEHDRQLEVILNVEVEEEDLLSLEVRRCCCMAIRRNEAILLLGHSIRACWRLHIYPK